MHRHLLCDPMGGVSIRTHRPESRVESDFGAASDLRENDATETARVCFRQHLVEQEALCDSLQKDKRTKGHVWSGGGETQPPP